MLVDGYSEDDIQRVAYRVLQGKGTPSDTETLALWTIAMSRWVRRLGEKEQR